MLKPQCDNFDFFQKDNNPAPMQKNNPLKSIFIGFILLQLVFLGNNTFKATDYLKIQNQKNVQVFNSFSAFQDAAREGNQNKMIVEYGKIQNVNTAISDVYASGAIQTMLVGEGETSENYRFKVNPETKEIIYTMYKNNLYSGLIKERAEINNIECFFLDFTCKIARPFIQINMNKEILQYLKMAYANKYNIDNPEEFKDWLKLVKEEHKSGKVVSYKNPGEKYIENVLKK